MARNYLTDLPELTMVTTSRPALSPASPSMLADDGQCGGKPGPFFTPAGSFRPFALRCDFRRCCDCRTTFCVDSSPRCRGWAVHGRRKPLTAGCLPVGVSPGCLDPIADCGRTRGDVFSMKDFMVVLEAVSGNLQNVKRTFTKSLFGRVLEV